MNLADQVNSYLPTLLNSACGYAEQDMKRHSKRRAFCCMKGGGILIAEDHAARDLLIHVYARAGVYG
jgi:hypothetical protein